MFGVGETVHVYVAPECTAFSLSSDGNLINTNADNDMFWAPWSGGMYELQFNVGTATLVSPITVYEPVARASSASWDGAAGTNGIAGTLGMNLEIHVYPMSVSFCGVWMVEIPDESGCCPREGYFANPLPGMPWSHTAGAGAGIWSIVKQGNEWTHDRAGAGGSFPQPWSHGWLEWDIPVGWGEMRDELVGQCAPNPTTQRFEIDANGTVTVRKFAHWIRRAVDGKIWLDGQRVH